MGRKTKLVDDLCGRLDKHDVKFGRMFSGMMRSQQYQALSIGAKQFLTCCRTHAQTDECHTCLYKHGATYGRQYSKYAFVFPRKHMELYGITNGTRYFKELIASGFVECVEDNHARKLVNVYEFSDKWKSL